MSAIRLFDKFQKLLDVTWGSIADGQTLKRSGSNIIGYTPGGGSGDVVGPASAVSGNIASYNGTTGKLIADGGKLAADVVTGPASVTTGRIATYNGTTGKIIQDGAKLGTDLVTGPASATTGRIASYGDTTGKVIADGAKLAADLVTGPASSVDSEVALFSGTGGKTIKRATGTGLVTVTSGVWQAPASVLATSYMPVESVIQTADVKLTGQFGPISSAAFDFATIPTASNGTEILSLPFIPLFATSKILIRFCVYLSPYVADWMAAWINRSGVANALNGSVLYLQATALDNAVCEHLDAAGSTAARTYSVRVSRGSSGNTNMLVNGIYGMGAMFGNTQSSTMVIQEIKQ